MASETQRLQQEMSFERAAQEYLRKLPLSHFMEAKPQATQREITLESLALVKARRPDFHVFNEMLVQYCVGDETRQVVPDNMVVLSDQPLRASTSYNVPLEPARPFWVFEYISQSSKRKDYEDSFKKYEQELQVPYLLLFYPEHQELTLYRHDQTRYVSVKPNEHGRYAIPEVDIEVGLLDEWVRYWYQGELLPLPAELQRKLEEALKRAEAEKRRAEEEKRRADEEKRRAEEAKRLADEEKRRADEEKHRAEEAKRRADEEKHRAEEAKRLADEEKRRADEAKRLADEEKRRADELQRRLEELEREMARLRNPPANN